MGYELRTQTTQNKQGTIMKRESKLSTDEIRGILNTLMTLGSKDWIQLLSQYGEAKIVQIRDSLYKNMEEAQALEVHGVLRVILINKFQSDVKGLKYAEIDNFLYYNVFYYDKNGNTVGFAGAWEIIKNIRPKSSPEIIKQTLREKFEADADSSTRLNDRGDSFDNKSPTQLRRLSYVFAKQKIYKEDTQFKVLLNEIKGSDLVAFGIAKGGLNTIHEIMRNGFASVRFCGPLTPGARNDSAYRHGPYFIIFEKGSITQMDSVNRISVVDFKFIIVDDDKTKMRLVNDDLRNELKTFVDGGATLNKVLSKVVTYGEAAMQLNEEAKAICCSII